MEQSGDPSLSVKMTVRKINLLLVTSLFQTETLYSRK